MSERLSRRRFLAAAAAGATLFEVSRILGQDVPGPQKQYAWYPMGIQTYSLRHYKAAEALQHVVALELHHVELFEAHLSVASSPEAIDAMKKQLRTLELAASAHGVNHFSKDHEKNRKIFEFANRAGIRNISADPDPDSFDSLEKLVAEYGIRIAIHNHGPSHRYSKAADVLKVVKGRHKWIGACADLGHYIRSAEDPVRVIHDLSGRLYGIHLKDFDAETEGAKGVILGKGHLDIAGVFRALREVGFPADGALSLEYEESESDPIADLKQCLAAAREGAQKAFSG